MLCWVGSVQKRDLLRLKTLMRKADGDPHQHLSLIFACAVKELAFPSVYEFFRKGDISVNEVLRTDTVIRSSTVTVWLLWDLSVSEVQTS